MRETDGNAVKLVLHKRKPGSINVPEGIIADILGDIKDNPVADKDSTSGNWNNLRLTQGGNTYEILSFDTEGGDADTVTPTFIQSFGQENADELLSVWVLNPDPDWDAGGGPPNSATAFGQIIDNVKIHIGTTSPPTEGLPLHIFSSSGDPQRGIHTAKFLRRIYNGDYGGTPLRISSSAFDDLEDETAFLPNTFWRIMGPQDMGPWLEEHIFKPYGIIPFIDSEGRIAPRSVLQPRDGLVDSTSLFEFKSSNTSGHPTWGHNKREFVNVVRSDFPLYYRPRETLVNPAPELTRHGDRIAFFDRTREFTHTNTTSVGRFTFEANMLGALPLGPNFPGAQGFTKFLSEDLFDRYGGGPIRGSISGMSDADAVQPGDFAKISIDTLPNQSATSGRGGTRVVQIMERTDTPAGPDFSYLDVGTTVLSTTPGFTLSTSTGSIHTIKITINSIVGTGYQMQWSVTATSESEPSSGSDEWTLGIFSSTGDANPQESTGTVELSPLPAGKAVWVQGRSRTPNQMRSNWSTAETVTLTPLATPSAVGQTTTTEPSRVIPTWTVGSSQYPAELYLDTTDATFDSSNYVTTLTPGISPASGSTAHGVVIEGLTTATSSTDAARLIGMRHVDAFGGVGAFYTTTVVLSTSAALPTLPDMRGINVSWGST